MEKFIHLPKHFMRFRAGLSLLLAISALLALNGPLYAASLIASQMGYHPQGPKTIYLQGYTSPEGKNSPPKVTFFDPKAPGLLPGMIGKTIYKDATLSRTETILPGTGSQGPGVPLWKISFDTFKTPGTYELRVDNEAVGQPVVISEFIFWDTMTPVLRSLYLMRSGSKVEYREKGAFDPLVERPASHLKDAFVEAYLASGKETLFRDVTGGWYNGGPDYAKYTPTTAYTTLLWMLAVQQSPLPWKTFKLEYPFGEPNLGDVRDVLHEMKHGLNWLMAMQRGDGKVYHQVNGTETVGDTRPEEDFQTRRLSGIYPQDTALTTAALALAAVAYQRSDVGYSVKCLMAAQKGWQALVKMPAQQRLATRGVPYVAPSAIQHRFLAAMAMYFATGESTYQDAAKVLLPVLEHSAPFRNTLSWETPLSLVTVWANTQPETSVAPEILALTQPDVAKARKTLQQWLNQSSLTLFPEGAEPNVAVLGPLSTLLAQAHPNNSDWELATQAAYRVVGLNGYRTSFITGVGTQTPQYPAMLLSQTLRKPIPGLVVAGPTENTSYADRWNSPANHAEIATTAQWGWVLYRLHWGFNQLSR